MDRPLVFLSRAQHDCGGDYWIDGYAHEGDEGLGNARLHSQSRYIAQSAIIRSEVMYIGFLSTHIIFKARLHIHEFVCL